MKTETKITILIALANELQRLEKYAEQYPDGGWSNEPVVRIKSVIEEVNAIETTK